MIAITRWHWALAVGFWIFLAAVYVAQLLWMPQSERINVGAALTWQLSYYAAWVPATIVIWRFTAGCEPAHAPVQEVCVNDVRHTPEDQLVTHICIPLLTQATSA